MLTRVNLVLWLVALALADGAFAQTTGRISGTVHDAQGGVLQGVAVTVVHDQTGLTRTMTTDADGAYVFVSLPIGTYSVRAELQGFQKGVKSGYSLVADGRVTADFALQVGQITETIEVTIAGETVNTVSGEIARVVDREQVQNLALNGRNYMQLATLIPGTPLLNLDALNIMTGLLINTSVNGGRGNSSSLMVDGGFNMDSGSNDSQISNVGVDFIEEVNIKTSSFSAEYGRQSGAAINVVTRGGSNNFRGSLYEYHRNESLDANDRFANSRNAARSELGYNDFGWTLGGPVKKNKLFFFAGQEWKRIRRQAAPALRTLPTRAMRNGNFSGLATSLRDPLTGQPFPGNVIPASRITADGRAMAGVYNAMEQLATSYTDTATPSNTLYQLDNPFNFRQDLLRVDWQASDAHRLTLRLLQDDYNLEDPFGTFIASALPTVPTLRDRPGKNYQLGHVWTMSSVLINELKANMSSSGQEIVPSNDAWKRETYGYAYPQIFNGGSIYENSIPNTAISGYSGFQGASQALQSPTRDIQVSNSLTWIKNDHAFKLGGLVARNSKEQNGRAIFAGQVDFDYAATNANSTGNSFADALLGNFRSYQEAQSDPKGYFRFLQVEAFASDNWRLSQSLSIEAGLRYMWHQPMYALGNNMANFDPALYNSARAVTVNRNGTLVPNSGDPYNGMVRAGDGVPDDELSRVPGGNNALSLSVPAGAPRGLYDSRHTIAPRFSFAWKAASDTAVRGGVGLFYNRVEGNLLFGGPNNGPPNSPPYNFSRQYENGNLSSPQGGTVPQAGPLGTLAAVDPNLKVPAIWNYSLSVQRQLFWNIFGEIGYVGSRGQDLLRQPDINQAPLEAVAANPGAAINFLRPYKGFSAIRARLSDSRSEYDALQVFLSRRASALNATLSYTYGRSKDDASDNGADTEELVDTDYNFGFSTFDRRHIVVATWTWQIPIFRGQTGIGRVLGGWAVSGIGRFQSGEPITVTGNTASGNRRADFLGGDPYYPESERITATGAVQWLRRAQFAAAPVGRRGNSPRGELRGPSYQAFDLSFRKQFAVTNDVRLQFQADLFNALNKVNYRNPDSNFTNAGFGTIASAAPPRNVQLGLRLTF